MCRLLTLPLLALVSPPSGFLPPSHRSLNRVIHIAVHVVCAHDFLVWWWLVSGGTGEETVLLGSETNVFLAKGPELLQGVLAGLVSDGLLVGGTGTRNDVLRGGFCSDGVKCWE